MYYLFIIWFKLMSWFLTIIAAMSALLTSTSSAVSSFIPSYTALEDIEQELNLPKILQDAFTLAMLSLLGLLSTALFIKKIWGNGSKTLSLSGSFLNWVDQFRPDSPCKSEENTLKKTRESLKEALTRLLCGSPDKDEEKALINSPESAQNITPLSRAFIQLAKKLRAREYSVNINSGHSEININEVINDVLVDLNWTGEQKERVNDAITAMDTDIWDYLKAVRDVRQPIYWYKQVIKGIKKIAFIISSLLTVPGEMALSLISMTWLLTGIGVIPEVWVHAIAGTTCVFSFMMICAVIYDSFKVADNQQIQNALKPKIGFSWRSMALTGFGLVAFLAGLGSTTSDLDILDEGRKLFFDDNLNPWETFLVLCMYMTLLGIGYRKIVSSYDYMVKFWLETHDIFYALPIPPTMKKRLLDILATSSKALAATFSSFSQMTALTGSPIVGILYALMVLMCTIPQSIAVMAPASQQKDKDLLLVNAVFSRLISSIYDAFHQTDVDLLSPRDKQDYEKVKAQFIKQSMKQFGIEIEQENAIKLKEDITKPKEDIKAKKESYNENRFFTLNNYKVTLNFDKNKNKGCPVFFALHSIP